MLNQIIQYSLRNKLFVFLLVAFVIGFGSYSLTKIPIGAVPDVTNNQVQVITTSRNLATEEVEKFLTYPVELEMANLPGVQEIRSISKFGLSVVTIVFDDDMGTYLPRQLIAEKIKTAEEKIPAGFGQPFMGPISTGLGEIYQYTLEVTPEYRNRYSLTDLRTMQDWIVRRQLSGIPGVIEVNTWGGYLKQYEVAVNPAKLRALHVPLDAVFRALENNNHVAGGSYIEKGEETYFIRGEGLATSLQDLANTVIENRNGTPIYVRDVAEVRYGKANRFGAITGNGEGEKVLGQIMMLKDANSKKVIEAVKKRVAEVQKTLPAGVYINPVVERSELIGKTTFTIAENLILGCLIVVFVVVVLLGNLRSGLVVASVIPLCLLFALSLMYVFGVDANLMSLGAIDFGIIIDGAVIIVEFIAFRVTQQHAQLLGLSGKARRHKMDEITFQGASKMMHSAVFGQLIIIIVFIPIFSLSGVEGKMFTPMALVFCFALIGAMLFCFTYVPVMASLLIRPGNPNKKNISQRLIQFLEKSYRPTIVWAMRQKAVILVAAIVLLGGTIALYSRMGGEFVPTLDEGDFVIQPVLKTGTSLQKTVETTTQIETILKEFPEVEQVVTRIGAAEVPTDPMSMEESDVIIKLKPKSEWVSASTKDGLADAFKEALSVIPGLDYEFTQPIEMRFNELITGVRADLAIKIFGEDLDILVEKAAEVERAIRDIEGAADISVEKIAGLPQMSVFYKRDQIAKYGVTIAQINQLIETGFAGKAAGMVFEGEKQFDLVVRFDEAHRGNLSDLSTTTLQLPNGTLIPLHELAEIRYTKGPAKISRDDTKRRIVVGVNVRNRDLESVVEDAQRLISEQVTLPSGYTITYGGQFENLRSASQRLQIAVPIALALIFLFLYFAFHSVKEALLIFSAIPLASVGGILLLYLRGMPFSISAGVGFIALFGIAVLNGIVLIEEFNSLKKQGITNVHRRVVQGALSRLRPVLLTASAAAMGFLPMALSTSAGAEVQRPLATVVVGGLISATILTLVVLPVLYALVEQNEKRGVLTKKVKPYSTVAIAFIVIAALPFSSEAQQTITLEEAQQISVQNNYGLRAAKSEVAQAEQRIGTSFQIGKTELYHQYDENNVAENGIPIRVWGITQSIEFPSVYKSRKNVLQQAFAVSQQEYALAEWLLKKEVAVAFQEALYWQAVRQQYAYLDSLYQPFANAATKRLEAGESNYLEKLTAEAKQQEVHVLLEQASFALESAVATLNQWLQGETQYTIPTQPLAPLALHPPDTIGHPILLVQEAQVNATFANIQLAKRNRLPEFQLEGFQGTNGGDNAELYNGFRVGVSVPIFYKAYKADVEVARTQHEIARHTADNQRLRLLASYQTLQAEVQQYAKGLAYYNTAGKALAQQLISHANTAWKQGEIDFLTYVQLLERATNIELQYLENLIQYNRAVIRANYLLR